MKKRLFSLLLAVMVSSMISSPVFALAKEDVIWFGEAAEYQQLLDAQFKNGLRKVKVHKKVGFANQEGDLVIPAVYDKAEEFSAEGYAIVTKNGKKGLVNHAGIEVVPPQYDEIHLPVQERIAVGADGKRGYYTIEGEQIVPLKYDGELTDFSSERAVVFQKGKGYGYIDPDGEEIIPLQYDGAESFRGDLAVIYRQVEDAAAKNEEISGLRPYTYVGAIDTQGREVLAPTYYNGHLPNSSAIVSTKGKMLLYPEIERIVLSDDVAELDEAGKPQAGLFGLFDYAGTQKTPFQYQEMRYYPTEQAFLVTLADPTNPKGSQCRAVIDAEGQLKSGLYPMPMEQFHGMRVVKGGDASSGNSEPVVYGAENAEGVLVVPQIYSEMTHFNEYGLAWAQLDAKWGMIDHNGNTALEFQFDAIEADMPEEYMERLPAESNKGYFDFEGARGFQPMQSYMEAVQKNGTGTAISTKGTIGRCTPFTAIARVKQNGQWGLVSPQGQVLTDCQYDSITAMDNGRAIVRKDGRFGVVDETGVELVAPCYDLIGAVGRKHTPFHEGLAMVRTDENTYNYIDEAGTLLLTSPLTAADNFRNGMAQVWFGRELGYIDVQGNTLIPLGHFGQHMEEETFTFIVKDGEIGFLESSGLVDAAAE